MPLRARVSTSLLMWDMRRNLDPAPIPPRRFVIQFLYRDVPASKEKWWLVVEGEVVDLCYSDPGFDVDLYVVSELRAMTGIWMGMTDVRREIEAGTLELIGDRAVADSMQQWLGLSPFAKEPKRAAGERAGPAIADVAVHGVVRLPAARLHVPAAQLRLVRMLPSDRNVMRLATYELLHAPDAVPVPVVLNEAIELAKVFGAHHGHRYVNGILDKLAERLRAEEVAVVHRDKT